MEVSGPAPNTQTAQTAQTVPGPTPVAVNGVAEGHEPVQPVQASSSPETLPEVSPVGSVPPPYDASPHPHPRCASLGDLLAEGSQQPKERLFRAQLEVKVASERTEKLMHQVRSGEPDSVNAEALLSQAVEQLRQATEVLQELRVQGEHSQDAPDILALAKKKKELVSLYRRSAP